MKNGSEPSPKVLAGTAGAGIGGALAKMIVEIFEMNGILFSDGFSTSLAIILGAVVAAAGGWLARDPYRDAGVALQEKVNASAVADANVEALLPTANGASKHEHNDTQGV